MSLNLLNGNSEALALLDWFELALDISSLSHFEKTKNRLNSPPRAQDSDFIRRDLNRLEQYLKHFDDWSVIFNSKLRMLPDGESHFLLMNDISKGKFFEASELNFFARLVEVYLESFPVFRDIEFDENFQIAPEATQKLKRQFITPLREFVDFSGNAFYERHPLLKKLSAEVLALESDLRVSIQKVAKSEAYNSKLQLDNYDIINDRYVLAIRSDSYQSELGPIVGRSQSGMTLFVEPLETREKANRRIFLLSEIEATILKLTIDLSKTVHQFAEEIKLISIWAQELDWLNTKATYSYKMHLTKPILSSRFHVELSGVFHPLLKNPVRNHLMLDNSHLGMIISGPNTGGKTVALKSLCVCVLFLHLGLYLPAQSAEIYPIDHLFYFSHDHQNLSEGLSSFASESKYYLELLTSLGDKNLIVVDEIFNSTSSEEASALAISFLDEIHARSKSKIIISTHHQVLKTYMHARRDYVSAHVGFDFENNRPTYKIITGEPGSSLAFKIFDNLSESFGLQTTISEKAKTLLDQKQITYESLLQELSQKKIELDKLLNSNRTLNIDLKNQKASMEGILFLEREKILNEYTKKIKQIFSRAETLYEEVKKGEIESKRNLSNQIGSIQSTLNSESTPKMYTEETNQIYSHMKPISFEEISSDMMLFSLTAKKNVKVLQKNPRKKEVQIKHGALSLWVDVSSLRWPSGGIAPAKSVVKVHVARTIKGEIEVDCRGMRLEEFQNACYQAIDEVITGEIPFVTIIHGHGDGILKNWLRTTLKKEFRELQWENIEGNDGCTKIYL